MGKAGSQTAFHPWDKTSWPSAALISDEESLPCTHSAGLPG